MISLADPQPLGYKRPSGQVVSTPEPGETACGGPGPVLSRACFGPAVFFQPRIMRALIKVLSGKAAMTPNLPWLAEPVRPRSSLLDPVEMPVTQDPCSPVDGTPDTETGIVDLFRHAGWAARRAAIADAMHYSNASVARHGNFKRCGADRWVMRSKLHPDTFKVVTAKCHDRFCSPCTVDRGAIIRRNLETKLTDGRYRFLTLTVRHRHEPLRTLLNRIYTAFRKLRQTMHWKDRVDGGVALLELTYGVDRNGWHPHLHCIIAGRYIDIVIIRRSWLAITGDSFQAHVRKIPNKSRTIGYVCRYATKAVPPNIFRDRSLIAEALDALHNRRLVLSFGTWKNYRLLEDPRERGWEAFDSISNLIARRRDDDELASRVLSMLPSADLRTGEFVVDLDLPPPEE